MKTITVTIPGEPMPYQRTTNRKGGGRRHTDDFSSYLDRVRMLAMQATARARAAGAPWPRDVMRYDVLVLVVRSTRQTCDVDNFAKTALDGCTGPQGLWLNDASVDDLRVRRCAPDKGDPCMVVIASAHDRKPLPITDLDWLTPSLLQTSGFKRKIHDAAEVVGARRACGHIIACNCRR